MGRFLVYDDNKKKLYKGGMGREKITASRGGDFSRENNNTHNLIIANIEDVWVQFFFPLQSPRIFFFYFWP